MACRGAAGGGVYHALELASPHDGPPPFPSLNSASFGSARSRPGREAAKRTLDGEDRFGMIDGEGKGGERSRGHGTTTDHEG